MFTKIMNIKIHPEEGVKVAKHRNLDFEVAACVALALVAMLASYAILGSAQSVHDQSQVAGYSALILK